MDTKKLRQKILDLAIRGKLVPQDPNDEPASVLLERIRAEKERLIKEGKIKRSKKTVSEGEIEAPFEIPESWEWVRLEDFVMAITDGDHQPPPQSKTGVPFLVISDVNTGVINFNHARFVSEEYYNNLPAIRRAAKGDILFTVTGSYGITILVDTEQIFCFQRHIGLVKTISCSEWITAVLQSDCVQKYCDKVATGTAQKTVSLGHLRDLVIPVPPLSEQKRIVNEIERWFTLIDELESNEGDLLKAIDKAKSKILDLAIHGKLVPQDSNDEPAIELLKRINPKFEPSDNESETNKLPNSWCWTTLGSIFQHNTGKALNKSDSQEGTLKPYLTTSNVYWNRFDFTEVKEMYFKDSELEKCTITKDDLLVCEGGDIGRAAIWNYDYDICIQNHLHKLRAKGQIDHRLYLYVLMLYKWTDKIHGKGIGLQGLSSGLLDKLVVPLPPYNEQIRIVAKIEEIFAVLDSIKESLEV